MRVQITKEAKSWLTIAGMPAARRIIAECKEDECIQDYGKMAAEIASRSWDDFEILKATAEIARNHRVYDNFFEGSGKLDVWLKFYALSTHQGFFEIGIYLTDVWQKSEDRSANEKIRQQMYICEYQYLCEYQPV